MRALRRGTVDVFVGEDDGRTYAEAALRDDVGKSMNSWVAVTDAAPARCNQ